MSTLVIPPALSSAEDIQEAIDGMRDVARHHADVSRQDLSEPLKHLYNAGYFTDAASLRVTIETFDRAIKSAPRIGLTLAAPIDPTHRTELTAWFRQNISSDIIVGFSHNRSLLGGILVRAGSHIYDWSYRSKLLDTPVAFTEVLDNVR